MDEQNPDVFTRNQCPYCGEAVEVECHLIGELITCPNEKCSRVFRIAVPDGGPVEPGVPVRRIKSDDERGVEGHPSRVFGESILFRLHPAVLRRRPLRAMVAIVVGLAGLAALALGSGLGMAAEAVHPALRQMPAWILLTAGGVATGSVIVCFLWWWLQSLFTTLTVTSKRTTYQEGIISRETSEVQHDDVRNLQIEQNLYERLVGIGDIAISSSGQDDMEIQIGGIAGPDRVAEVIRQYQ